MVQAKSNVRRARYVMGGVEGPGRSPEPRVRFLYRPSREFPPQTSVTIGKISIYPLFLGLILSLGPRLARDVGMFCCYWVGYVHWGVVVKFA